MPVSMCSHVDIGALHKPDGPWTGLRFTYNRTLNLWPAIVACEYFEVKVLDLVQVPPNTSDEPLAGINFC